MLNEKNSKTSGKESINGRRISNSVKSYSRDLMRDITI